MRVPSLAALAAICAACADGTPTANTTPSDLPSFAISGAAARQIANCDLSPRTLTLAPGANAALTITCYDAGGRRLGNPEPHHANYATANGAVASVSGSGVVTARASGTTTLRGWHPERPFNDTITVSVTGSSQTPTPAPSPTPSPAPAPTPSPSPSPTPSPIPPPPTGPPAPVAGFPNQPSGMIFITDRQFDSKARDNDDRGSGGSDGWSGTEYRFPNFTIVNDPSAPNGDGKVGQMRFPANMQAGTGPAISTIYFPAGLREVYISVWARLSSNWVGNQASINKMFFVGVAGGNNQFIFTAYGSGSNSLEGRMSLQGIVDKRSFLRPNRGIPAQVVRNQWQRWEFVLRCNSSNTVADGTADLWINGAHVTSVRDINWTQSKYPTRPCNMNVFNWNPTYGGGGASPGVDQYLWFDRVYVSGR